MANIKVRYLVTKRGRGGAPRYFWQPSKGLQRAGWKQERLAANVAPAKAEGLAIEQAQAINRQVDAWRTGATVDRAPGAQAGAGDSARNSINALIADYKRSRYYLQLKPKSRKLYDYALARISAWAGDVPARAITAARVDALYDALRANNHASANAILAVLRRLLGLGVRWNYLATNPAASPNMVGLPKGGIIWPRAAIAHMVATADAIGLPSIGTAIALNEWCGQRKGDIVALPRQLYRDGILRVVQSKTKARVNLPIAMVETVAARLEAEFKRHADAGVTPINLIVEDGSWQPYTEKSFTYRFGQVRAAAAETVPAFAVDGDPRETVATARLRFGHLRHTAVTRLAEHGCELAQISGVTGHSMRQIADILEHYLTRTTALSAGAFQKRLDAEGA